LRMQPRHMGLAGFDVWLSRAKLFLIKDSYELARV